MAESCIVFGGKDNYGSSPGTEPQYKSLPEIVTEFFESSLIKARGTPDRVDKWITDHLAHQSQELYLEDLLKQYEYELKQILHGPEEEACATLRERFPEFMQHVNGGGYDESVGSEKTGERWKLIENVNRMHVTIARTCTLCSVAALQDTDVSDGAECGSYCVMDCSGVTGLNDQDSVGEPGAGGGDGVPDGGDGGASSSRLTGECGGVPGDSSGDAGETDTFPRGRGAGKWSQHFASSPVSSPLDPAGVTSGEEVPDASTPPSFICPPDRPHVQYVQQPHTTGRRFGEKRKRADAAPSTADEPTPSTSRQLVPRPQPSSMRPQGSSPPGGPVFLVLPSQPPASSIVLCRSSRTLRRIPAPPLAPKVLRKPCAACGVPYCGGRRRKYTPSKEKSASSKQKVFTFCPTTKKSTTPGFDDVYDDFEHFKKVVDERLLSGKN